MVSKLAGLIAKQKENQNGSAATAGPAAGTGGEQQSRLVVGSGSRLGTGSAESKPAAAVAGAAGTVLPPHTADSANVARPKPVFGAKRPATPADGVPAAVPVTLDGATGRPVDDEGGLTHVDAAANPTAGSVPTGESSEATAVPASPSVDEVPHAGPVDTKPKLAFGKRAQATPAVAANNPGTTANPAGGLTGGLAALSGVKSTPLDLAERGSRSALDSASGADGAFSLDDIAGFDSTDDGPTALEIYNDMIPADMPDRELPEDMTEGMESFVDLIRSVYDVLNDPEQFGSTIRNLMLELQENPEYDKMLVDEDVNTMMRGLRQTMGLAQIKKSTTKKGAAKKPASGKHMEMATSLDGLFDSSDFE